MKKKVRDIVVDGTKYAWNVFMYDEGCPYPVIRIWEGKNNEIFSQETNSRAVKPRDIEKIIRKVKELP